MAKKFFVFTIILFLLAVAIQAVYAKSEEKRTENFLNNLENNGFIAQEGKVDFPDMAELGCKCNLPTGYAYNPASPYGIFVLPPAPDQAKDIKNPYSEWYEEDNRYPEGWSWFVRQRPDEAIVYIGTTPPEMDYFSLLHYLFDRSYEGYSFPDCIDSEGDVRMTPPSAMDRFPIFASLGDSINNMTMKVTGGNDSPFNEPVVVIIVSDQEIEREIRKMLLKAGFSNQIINKLVVPPGIVRMGVEDNKDTFFYAWRLHSERTPELEKYIESPGRIFRVSPERAVPPSEIIPVETPDLRVRGTGTSEMDLLPAVDALGEAIIAEYPECDAIRMNIIPWPEGYHCLENEQVCLADNRDDAAFASAFNPFTLSLLQGEQTKFGPDSFYIAYGVNHRETGKATYTSVTLVNWRNKISPASFKNSQMSGSAEQYLGDQVDPAVADKLYAWKIVRPENCIENDSYCQEVADDECIDGIGEDDPIAFIFRAYVEPETKTGPATNEVIMDRVIKFIPKK